MGAYSIKDLERLSGIKAHTLRIWEQRYQFIRPKRTQTNIRYYNEEDLKLILNIALLRDNGYKISRIAEMSTQEMQLEVLRITESTHKYPDQIHALTLAMLELDEAKFEKLMATNILKLGFERTMTQIIFPFLHKIGVLWQTGAIIPAQEHFITNLIRQKLIVAIDGLYPDPHVNYPKYILFLPEGELHELTLLFAHYILKSRNNRVIYFGQTLPFEDLKIIYDIHKPDCLMTFITNRPSGKTEVQSYLQQLSSAFPNPNLVVSGGQVIDNSIKIPENIILLEDLPSLVNFIEKNSPALKSNSF